MKYHIKITVTGIEKKLMTFLIICEFRIYIVSEIWKVTISLFTLYYMNRFMPDWEGTVSDIYQLQLFY